MDGRYVAATLPENRMDGPFGGCETAPDAKRAQEARLHDHGLSAPAFPGPRTGSGPHDHARPVPRSACPIRLVTESAPA
jgi:hypothetical protein